MEEHDREKAESAELVRGPIIKRESKVGDLCRRTFR
jgi:hypothetical protein